MKSIAELFDLRGMGAVVTGGAVGIGKGIARRLAEAGAGVLVADLNSAAAADTATELAEAGYQASPLGADVARPADAERLVQTCVERFGNLKVLVNNAGIYPFSRAETMSEKDWDRVLDVNLKGAFFCAQAAAKAMKASGGGAVVNIASIDALHPSGNLVHYDASKGGLLMLTRSLAREWAADGIRVNAILPGAIATPGTASQNQHIDATGVSIEEVLKTFTARIPMARMGEADDIGKVALFLASDASSYMTGAHVVVDGGFLLS